jgi:PAS domain-containing protein
MNEPSFSTTAFATVQLGITRRLASELAPVARAVTADRPALRTPFDDMPMVCLLTDGRGVILDANRAAASFLKIERALLRRRALLHFVARADTRMFRACVREMGDGALEPIVARLRPRGGVPCRMLLVIERVPGRSDVLWTATPCL